MEDINEYMKEFKKNSENEKKQIILDQLKNLTVLTNTMCKELDIKNEIFLTQELFDANDGLDSEDEFLNATIVYINSIQNSICDFADNINDKLEGNQ